MANLWCDFPINDAGGKCMKPARAMSRGGLRRCKEHAARLPYWPPALEDDRPASPADAPPV
jgi:hypothetical protein